MRSTGLLVRIKEVRYGSSWHHRTLSDRLPSKGSLPDPECWIHALHACATDAGVFVCKMHWGELST